MDITVIICIAVVIIVLVGILIYLVNKLVYLNSENKLLNALMNEEINKQQLVTNELSDLKKQLAETQESDIVTALPSREIFNAKLIEAVNMSKRYQLTFGILFLNIDDFKVINNALGYDVGDKLLKLIAERLQQSVRQVDTISRFAADEFILLAPQISKAETCGYIAKRMLDELSQPFKVNDQDIYVTASIGIAVYPQDGEDAKVLLSNADNALNKAKARGCNHYQFYQHEMYELSQRELILKSSLSSLSLYNDLLIYYQPQVNVVTKEITCMEALLRWQHPQLGLISPGEFIRLAENSGKIIEIGDWVIRQACEQLQKWKDIGLIINKVAVNVSYKQLENPHFVYNVAKVLEETNTSADSLILEINDGIFNKIDLLDKSLQMLKQLGIELSLDDFGTRHLSLQQLKLYKFDYIKLDASLTQEFEQNVENKAIIILIIQLAKTLNLRVVAEGVETLAQKLSLMKLGCQLMQGHLFSPARRSDEFTVLMSKEIVEQ